MFNKLFLLLLACSCGITDILAAHNITRLPLTKSCSCGIDHGSPIVQELTTKFKWIHGTFWDHHTQNVLIADRGCASFSKYNLKSGSTLILPIKELENQKISSVYTIAKREHQYIMAANHSLYLLKTESKNNNITYTIKEVMKVMDESQVFSTSITTSKGNLIIGTKPKNNKDNDNKEGKAQLLRVNMTSQKVETIDTGFSFISGVCFNIYNRYLYVSDGKMGKIWQYRYNVTTGKISDKKVIYDVEHRKHTGHGNISALTMDREGRLWIGMKGYSEVLVLDLHLNKVVHKISITATTTSSLTWGGKQHSILFVGTTRVPKNHNYEPAAGRILGISGTGSRGFKIQKIHVPDNI